MKTADLIPFILLELNDGNKYGLEITKNIETKSNGLIVIKQPTLYTVLKKLEKSKFISSYWEDSEIGGKRHYYKLTEFGRLQVSTLPPYQELLKSATEQDEELEEGQISEPLAAESVSPIETILPTEEVFKTDEIDNITEAEINLNNSNILKEEPSNKEEEFAQSEVVFKFVQTSITPAPVTQINTEPTSTEINSSINDITPAQNIDEPIKYIDYKNLKTDASYIKEKKTINGVIVSSVLSSLCILIISLFCNYLTNFSGSSALFYIFLISIIVVSVFLPIITYVKIDKLKNKYTADNFKFTIKKQSLISLTIILLSVIVAFVFNIFIENNTFIKLFSFGNFENLYAVILLSATTQFAPLFNWLLLKNINK